MKIIRFVLPLVMLAFVASSCNNDASKDKEAVKTDSSTVGPKTDAANYSAAVVDNVKDPSCGMPVTAGVGDTLHYNNKSIGFCSKECKDAFLKDKDKNFASVEWKK